MEIANIIYLYLYFCVVVSQYNHEDDSNIPCIYLFINKHLLHKNIRYQLFLSKILKSSIYLYGFKYSYLIQIIYAQ